MSLTPEEAAVLAQSPICLNCNHKVILHEQDSEYGTQCHICNCTEVIQEGDTYPWSYETAMNRLRHPYLYAVCPFIARRMMEEKWLGNLSAWLTESAAYIQEPTDNKIIRIQRVQKLKLPGEQNDPQA